MLLPFLPAWPIQFHPLVMGAFALLLATLAGEIMQRFLALPRITGYSLAGLLFGPACLGWIGGAEMAVVRLFVDLVLALLLFEIGIRVNLRWFRANPMILVSSLLESLLAFAGMFAVTYLILGIAIETALVVATVGMATSPAVVMTLTGQIRARGQVSDRLMVLTALNVIYAILASKMVLAFIHRSYGNEWGIALTHPIYQLSGSLLIAFFLAKAFLWLRLHFDPAREQASLLLFLLLLMTMALLQSFKLPALLAPLLAGVLVRYLDPRPHVWPLHFGSIGGVMVILLFVMIGASLSWSHLGQGGLLALVLIMVRGTGKFLGVLLPAKLTGLSLRQSVALGVGLLPMSGVAFILTADIGQLFPELNNEVRSIVMSMIFVLELLGPILLQRSLVWVGEAQKGGRHGA